ncbi:MAG: short-chain dehydrogenase/reductase [Solirubrobacterales bacterium 70-9]|nr:MAG: short-chain dehydrogenase/reductase [Solirubrobacterales bacterium 70-9]
MTPQGDKKTLFITGTSRGLGRALGEAAVQAGHRIVGTVQSEAAAEAVEALGEGARAEILDIADGDAIAAAVARTEREVGPIDVVVANAGYGQEGTFEESTMEELRKLFDVNFFGAVATIKTVLPAMRERRSGHVIGVTSMGGLMTIPSVSFYHSTKFALEGILGSLAKEVAPLGVKVTAVAPGSFRTEWAGTSLVRAPQRIADYEPIFAPLRAARELGSGNQLGDPAAAAKAILDVVEMEQPPVHLLLGSDALRLVGEDRARTDAEIRKWEELSRSTDFPDGAQIASTWGPRAPYARPRPSPKRPCR